MTWSQMMYLIWSFEMLQRYLLVAHMILNHIIWYFLKPLNVLSSCGTSLLCLCKVVGISDCQHNYLLRDC
jgi:hypothetical protein